MKKIWSAVTVVLLTAVSAGVIVYGSSVSDRKIDTSGNLRRPLRRKWSA